MKVYEIKAKVDAERKAKESAFTPIVCDGVETPASELNGLELPDFNGIPSDVLFTVADVSYRVAGVRTSRLVQSDAEKEIGGLVAYLLDSNAKNKKQRESWLVTYVKSVSRLVGIYRTNPNAFDILGVVADLRVESAEIHDGTGIYEQRPVIVHSAQRRVSALGSNACKHRARSIEFKQICGCTIVKLTEL